MSGPVSSTINFINIINYAGFIYLYLNFWDETVSSDPVEDVVRFISLFQEKYGNNHPVFYQGSYSQALSDAKQELRFLLVYLHKEDNPSVDQWCR